MIASFICLEIVQILEAELAVGLEFLDQGRDAGIIGHQRHRSDRCGGN